MERPDYMIFGKYLVEPKTEKVKEICVYDDENNRLEPDEILECGRCSVYDTKDTEYLSIEVDELISTPMKEKVLNQVKNIQGKEGPEKAQV